MFSYLSSTFHSATGMHLIYVKLKSAATTIRAAVAAEATDIPHLADEVLEIPSRETGRSIKVDVYRPANPPSDGEPRYLINMYGSYFVIDALQGSDVEFLQAVAEKTGYTVYDIHYRLAPEYPFPAAIQDGEDVINSLPPNAKIALSGFGSGGTLALSLSSTSTVSSRISTLCVFYPPVDLSLTASDLIAPDTSVPPRMSLEAAGVLNECYLYHDIDSKNPSVSPAYAPPESFPQDVFFFTAAQDVYCLSGEELAGKIQAAGKTVRQKRYEGCASLFDKRPDEGSEKERQTKEAYGMIMGHLM